MRWRSPVLSSAGFQNPHIADAGKVIERLTIGTVMRKLIALLNRLLKDENLKLAWRRKGSPGPGHGGVNGD